MHSFIKHKATEIQGFLVVRQQEFFGFHISKTIYVILNSQQTVQQLKILSKFVVKVVVVVLTFILIWFKTM